ncbi:RDD family protein [Streptomyces orinoci]|uniref:RDD family protein n=1 Tax=Streptomyces orinoci TaxID=67339 RepID=A0ABV3K7R9_STRON|nr:RDD family protein [Streptomyces orinoci]
MSAPIPGSADSSPGAGFYPDPSIPGYIRYWSGTAWVPGTSRPAPAEGEPMPGPPPGVVPAPLPAPAPAAPVPPAARSSRPLPEETGPVFLDEEPQEIGDGRPVPPPRDPRLARPLGPAAEVPPAPVPATAAPAAGEGTPGFGEPRPRAEGTLALRAESAPVPATPSRPGPPPAESLVPRPWPGGQEAPRPEPPARPAPAVQPQQPQPQQIQPQLSPQPQPPQVGWAQQVHQLAQQAPPSQPQQSQPLPGPAESAPAPWKPPVLDPFLAAAQRQGRPAPLARRLAARLVDSLVLGGAVSTVAVPLWNKSVAHIDDKVDQAKRSGQTVTVWLLDGTTGTYLAIVLGVLLLAGVLYEALPTAKWGRTLGKKLCGVRVLGIESHDTPSLGEALRRWLVYGLLGALAIGVLNVLWGLFDRPWRQCWHDKAAGTFVAAGSVD